MEITRAEARKRLLMIARKTEQVPPDRFNFEYYAGNDWQGMPNLSCGTSACAIGHSCTLPYFRKLGLRLARTVSGYIIAVVGESYECDNNQSVAALLGLTVREYEYVFLPGSNNELGDKATNKEVAAHIRHFVDWRFPEFAKHPAWPVRT